MADRENLFEALKRSAPHHAGGKSGANSEIFFQIRETDAGFAFQVVDHKGAAVDADYRVFHGVERDLLKAYDEVRWSWDATRLWDETEFDGSGVLLHEHSHLIRLLERSGRVVDRELKPLNFHPNAMELQLVLDLVDADWARGGFRLRSTDGAIISLEELRLISESHLMAGQTVYRIQSLGMGYRSLALFSDSVAQVQLNEFLSLFFSSFSSVRLDCRTYSVSESEPIPAQATLVFQQVDENSALHLDIVQAVPGFSIEFARDYDLGRVAFVDEMEGIIRVRDVLYGDVLAARASLMRRLKKIAKATRSSEAYLIDDEEGLVLGPELASVFLHEHLAEVMKEFDLFGAEKLKAYKVRHVEPSLDVSLGHGIDFLEGDATLDLEGEQFGLFDALQQYRKQKYIALSDGTHAVLDERYMDRLARLFKKNKKGVRISFFDLPLIEELMEKGAARSQLPASREVFRGFNSLEKKRLQLPRFVGKLRPYQTAGVKWLDYLHEHQLGGCLADDMGLGKTIQAIALLTRIYPKEKKTTLLVMPRSLLFNWRRELETFAPELSVYTYYATNRDLDEGLKHQLVLTTYGTLRSDIEAFSAVEFHAVILDESQAIKNLKTQTAKAVLALRCAFRLGLSGTPIENNLGELYTLFRFLNPSMFGSAGEFERDYVAPIQRTGDKVAANELRRKINPFILRRLKADVLKELPPKVEQVLLVEMGAAQRKFYETRRRFYQELIQGEIQRKGLAQSRFAVLEALLELRQIATVPESKSDGAIVSAKREMLEGALQEAVQNNCKCLVFTNFLAGVEQVCTMLNELEIEHVSMTGATANRAQLVERFQNDPQLKVFVMTLKTGGVGLNLTAADTVFILDPWWNTSAEAQAIDRTHRIGQKKTVFTYRLIAENSIEEKIMKLQQHKKDLVDLVVSSDGAALKSLSEEDIDHLLGA
ncbi:SNF2-related protein [Pontiellaceae bacterium B1224]|nr:SNF2-related protein [Pontiellaceae bacterium B1224]